MECMRTQDRQLGREDFVSDHKIFDMGLHAFRLDVAESDLLKEFITETLLAMVAQERGNEVINKYGHGMRVGWHWARGLRVQCANALVGCGLS
jgi:hypothetical protein